MAHKRKVILGKVLAYIVIRLGILQVIALLSCQAGKVLDHREQAYEVVSSNYYGIPHFWRNKGFFFNKGRKLGIREVEVDKIYSQL